MEAEYDFVLVGTNLVMSILAAALARSGRRVLCIDDADSYGGDCSTFTLTEMRKFMAAKPSSPQPAVAASSTAGGAVLSLSGSSNNYFALELEQGETPLLLLLPSLEESSTYHRSSDFGFDLTAQLVFSRGLAVDVLAESGVARYLEFQVCDGCYYYDHTAAHTSRVKPVPHSKNQVFTSSELSMLEKRQLMRFLQLASDFANHNHEQQQTEDWINDLKGAANPGRSLVRPQNKSSDQDLLAQVLLVQEDNDDNDNGERLTLERFLIDHVRMASAKLRQIILYSVVEQENAAGGGMIGCRAGMERVARYLGAMGRFGSTPFLLPAYGTSELCQAFSRMCSVYGGTCALRMRPVRATNTAAGDDAVELELHDGTSVRAKRALVVQASYCDDDSKDTTRVFVVRVVCVVRGKQTALGKGKAYLVVPPTPASSASSSSTVFVVQHDHTTHMVPQGMLLQLDLTTRIIVTTTMEEEGDKLAQVAQRLVGIARELIGDEEVGFTAAAFAKRRRQSRRHGSNNIYVVGDDDDDDKAARREMQVDESFRRARKLFYALCGSTEEPFLPASEAEQRARAEEREAAAATMPSNATQG